MADGTGIEWTDATWNPIRGCSRVSEGCRHCYAETVAARFSGPGQPYAGLARFVDRPDGTREARWTGKVKLVEDQLLTPLRWQRPRRIFVNSMSDLFHENISDDTIDRVFAVMALAHWHTFQILTKRPERMRQYFAETWQPAPARQLMVAGETISLAAETRPGDRWDQVDHAIDGLTQDSIFDQGRFWTPEGDLIGRPAWPRRPLPNVWLGVSVEDQDAADERIPLLLDTPASVRFISAEPLLGPVDLIRAGGVPKVHHHPDNVPSPALGALVRAAVRHLNPGRQLLDWVIAGGESGPGARAMQIGWARSLRDQCEAAGVAFFFKQWGEWAPIRDEPASETQEDEELRGVGKSIGGEYMRRVGKRAAGSLLDGRKHAAWPGARS